ncbi:DNA topoisomerase, partial [Cetobacterium sp.]|uniref:DNA topoisomerase n=1 Tax=Cetobacterium sp. TaxID=2071632 RepID=UPI003EE5AA41
VPPKEILENGKVIDKVLLEELEKEIHGIHKLEISKDIVKNEAPLPFNLIELQQYANKKWGYGSNDVLKITQELRDQFKAITYNRSDSQYLSREHFKEAPEVIPQILKNLNIVVPGVNFNKMSKCFNDENVTAHHAIIPTNTTVDLTKLDDMQRNIYIAISNYYIAQFLPALVSEKTTGEIKIYDEIVLRSTSTKVLDYGYKAFLNDKLDDEEQESKTSTLSALYSGIYETTIDGTKILQKETAPKKLYTEATLLKDMTAISKYVSDPILKQALKNKDKDKKGENGGIGTPATRSPIISEIFKDKDIVNQDKYIIPTEKGIKIYQYIADEIKTANVTAEWWLIQSEIEESKAEPIKLLKKLEEDFMNIMSREFGRIDYIDDSEDKTVFTCPKCGKKIYESKIS